MKKCLLLIPRMGNGGAERVMATIANNLCRDHEVRIVTMTDAECFYPLDSHVSIMGLNRQFNRKNKMTKLLSMTIGGVKGFAALRRMIMDWQPDVLLSFLQATNAIAILLKLSGVKCRVVVSERCAPEERDWFNRWFEKNFYHRADVVVCQSKAVLNFFHEKHLERMVIIPNPIASDAIPMRYEGERRRVVVGIGRLLPQKNFPMLINAFSKLPDILADYSLEIYGGGPMEKQLQDQIDTLGLNGRIKLMGIVPGVMHHIANTSLFVLSSDFEGFPNVLAEAMATGLPVISTDFSTGVARDLVKERNGIIIPVGDENALTEAMKTILLDDVCREKMSYANRELLDTLSEQKVMTLWNEVLGLVEDDDKG